MIRANGQDYCIDPASGVVRVLGKQWSLPLIVVLGNRPRSRFRELEEAIAGMRSKVLSQRLKEMAELGLVDRSPYPGGGGGEGYRLTPEGLRLREALLPLLHWANEARPANRR